MPKVLYEKRDRIAYVTINRPEARNAIDPDVHRLMVETMAPKHWSRDLEVNLTGPSAPCRPALPACGSGAGVGSW
jgi:1,4-dihydroxy-2-naphthoyl-CoA synthase